MLMMEMAVMPLMMVGLVLVVVVVMVMMMMVMMKIFSAGGGDAQNQRIPRESKNVQDHDHLMMVHEDHTEDDSF
jgi:biopolymer transport protein ExbB/TolQ